MMDSTSLSPERARKARIQALLAACHDDPALFNSAILGRPDYWGRQHEMCDLVQQNRTSVIVSGNSVGKSWWLAGIVLWYLFTRPNSIVLCTAPTHTQLAGVLFRNIKDAWANSRIPLGGSITKSQMASPQLLKLTDNWFAIGLSTTAVDKISGIRAATGHTLVAVDEGSGIKENIWEGLHSLVYEKLVAIGNPLRTTGKFYELGRLAQEPGSNIGFMRVSSLESPDIEHEISPRGLACQAWLAENRLIYGENSLWWLTHVLAQWPEQDSEVVVPLSWIDACLVPHQPGGPRRLSCDLAGGGGGDYTVLVVRDDNGIYEMARSNTLSLEAAAATAKRLVDKYGIHPYRVSFDQNGLGADWANRLAAVGLVGCQGYNGSHHAKGQFLNRRAYCFWQFRRRLDPHRGLVATGRIGELAPNPVQFSIPPDVASILREELGHISYKFNEKDQTQITTRKEVKVKLKRSPDVADAVVQGWCFNE